MLLTEVFVTTAGLAMATWLGYLITKISGIETIFVMLIIMGLIMNAYCIANF